MNFVHLAYLSRYTHRVAISNRRLLRFDGQSVTFKWKDYRCNKQRHKTMTLSCDEFIRRFLIHVLPPGFHRIRHYGLLANSGRVHNLKKIRELIQQPTQPDTVGSTEIDTTEGELTAGAAPTFVCPHCGQPMIVIEVLLPDHRPRAPPGLSS